MYESSPVISVSEVNTYIKSILTTDSKLKFIRVPHLLLRLRM